MIKKGVYFLIAFSLVIIVFGIIGVIAQSSNPENVSCTDDQVILTLSKLTNAHAGIPGQNNHSVKVCYSSIFNEQYLGANPSQCKNNSDNRILILSDVKNAHATSPNRELGAEEISLCYGDLSCRIAEGSCNSAIGEKRVVSLDKRKDSHLSLLEADGYNLNICCSVQRAGNTSLLINIIKPKMWENFSVSQAVEFEVEIANSSSLGSDIDITWDFDDGNITTIDSCISKGKCNIKHIYSNQAHYIIKANAKKQNSSETSSDHVDILVYKNGLNLFAIISNPEFGENIQSNTPVSFNGNQSFIAQCGSSCPSGKQCYTIPNSQLVCYNFAKPARVDLNGALGDYLFWFNWTFDKGKQNADDKSIIGTWNLNYTGVVEFDRTFFTEGNHTATLIVGYESTG